MTNTRVLLPAVAASALLLATLAVAPANAAPPFDEVNDIQWCVDQTSQTVRNVIQTYASSVVGTYDANYRALKCKLHQHAPITINGNDLAWQNAQGNPALLQADFGIVAGSGTSWDPYLIQNWEFPGSDEFRVYTSPTAYTSTGTIPEYDAAGDSAIAILDTDQHFVISKVYAHGWSGTAIRIGHASSTGGGYPTVQVLDSVITRSLHGIDVFNWASPPSGQPNVLVQRDLITDTGEGVHASSSWWTLPLQVSIDLNSIHTSGTAVVVSGHGGYVGSNTIESGYRGIESWGLGRTIAWNTVTAPRGVFMNAGNSDPSWGPVVLTQNRIYGQDVEYGGIAAFSFWDGAYVDSSYNYLSGGWAAVYMEDSNIRMYGDTVDCSRGVFGNWCAGLNYRGYSTAQVTSTSIHCHGGGWGIGFKVPAEWPVLNGVWFDSCPTEQVWYS